MNNYLSLFPLFASPLLQAALCIPLNTTKPTVTLASGVVIGTTTLLPAATAPVHKYLGIPFAASPPERFSAPTDPAAWHTPLQAFSYQASCIQQFNGKPNVLPSADFIPCAHPYAFHNELHTINLLIKN